MKYFEFCNQSLIYLNVNASFMYLLLSKYIRERIRIYIYIEKNTKYYTQKATMYCVITMHHNFSKVQLQIEILTNITRRYIIIINIYFS